MRRLATAVSCLALAAITACSDPEASEPSEPEDSVGAANDSSTTSSGPDDAAITSAPVDARGEDPGVPELPPEAMEDTEAGAEAFVQYYIDLLNYTGRFPKSGLLEPHSDSDCSTCEVLEKETADLEAAANRYEIDSLAVDTIEALPFDSGYRVQLQGEALEAPIVGRAGNTVAQTEPVPDLAWAIQLNFESSEFHIEWIKSVE